MLSTKHAKLALKVIIPLFVAVFSICVLAAVIPETKFVESSVESLEKSQTTVKEFMGATIATSLAISALPDDFASPLANELAGMNRYFVLMLIVIFAERLLVVEGIGIAFRYVVPLACGLYAVASLTGKKFLKVFAYKVGIFGAALILVVPCSTHFTDVVGKEYLAYVDETIAETKAGADKINEVTDGGDADETIFEKLSEAFKTAIEGVNDLIAYFNNAIKKCMNSIAILIVTTVVMPFLTLLFFKWLLKELFRISIPVPGRTNFMKKSNPVTEEEDK